MAPIFASEDIAPLVASFPPPQPVEDAPSLVRSLSGNSLFNSYTVSKQFLRLLKSRGAGDRIKLTDLPSLLQIKSTGWLLNLRNEPLRFSQDKRSIISPQEFKNIVEELQSNAHQAFVELQTFANEKDISPESIDKEILDEYALSLISSTPSSSIHVSSKENVRQVRQNLESLLRPPVAETIDLSQQLSDVPGSILQVFGAEIIDRTNGLRGKIGDHEDRILFMPVTQAVEPEMGTGPSIAEEAVQHLITKGFTLPLDVENFAQLEQDIIRLFKSTGDKENSELIVLEGSEGNKAIITNETLQKTLDECRSALISIVKENRVRGSRTPSASDKVGLESQSTGPRLVSLLLQSQYRETLDAELAYAIDRLDQELRHLFERLLQIMIMAPLDLYSASSMGDDALKQNQEAFIGAYFCREVVPNFVETARRTGLLQRGPFPGDRARLRDTEILEETCGPNGSKTLTEVQAAVTRLARKQNISEPSIEQIKQVKRETLEQKGKVIRKMIRGSDVLQNLIWILFARRIDGLFMSAGRDTSRMIEQYKVAGDVATWKDLVKWRDLLKAGKEEAEDIREMKELAIKALSEMEITVAVKAVEDSPS